MKIWNWTGHRILLWGTPDLLGRGDERIPLSIESHILDTRLEEVGNPGVELALDARDREFAEQGRMPGCVESSRHVQRDCPDLMSDMKGLHPLLGETKQHVQGGVTLPETKSMILSNILEK